MSTPDSRSNSSYSRNHASTPAAAEAGPGTSFPDDRLSARPSLDESGHQAVVKSPRVSVVIPTSNRPLLLGRALRSVLAQTLADFEVIVVHDGRDAETETVLNLIEDIRLRVLSLPQKVGGSEARNIGVRHARSRWIAFLDDDDQWMPRKLATQVELAESAKLQRVLIASRFLERGDDAERVLPGRLPGPSEAFSDYLFSRQGWSSGEGFLQTSTWLVSKTLMLEVPFTVGLKRCQDLDWLLHATSLPAVAVIIAPEVLAVFHHEERSDRVSRTADWKFLYDWAAQNRAYFTPRAYSFFLATFCAPSAAVQGESLATLAFLMRRSIAEGGFHPKSLLLAMLCWCIPEPARRALRRRIASMRTAWTRVPAYQMRQQNPGKVG